MSLSVGRIVCSVVAATGKSLPAQMTRRTFRSLTSTWMIPRMTCVRSVHSKESVGDKELVDFLSEEILVEKKLEKPLPDVSGLGGFSVVPKGAQLTFTKKYRDETVTILLNVNHSVNADEPEDIDPKMDKPEVEMKSRPAFDVEIKRGDKKFCFQCSFFTADSPSENIDDHDDVFSIDEVCIYSGELTDETYVAGGDLLDSYMYDLFMNLLEERGVTSDLVDAISDYSTSHEHKLFVGLLEDIRNFVSGK